MAGRKGLVLSTTISSFFPRPGHISLWEKWLQCPGEKFWVIVLAFQAHFHSLYYPPCPHLQLTICPTSRPVLSLENVDLEPRQAVYRGCLTEGWDKAGRGEEPSLPSLSCLAEHSLAWSLAEAPAWVAGPQEGEACPSSLHSQGAAGWLLQTLGAMTPGAGVDSAPSWLCPEH